MATDPNILLAAHAPPPRKIPLHVWIGGAVAAFLFVGMVGIGLSKLVSAGPQQAGVDDGKAVVEKPKITKPVEEWNFQEIQDHLAANGMKTRRGMGAKGMLFCPGDGPPLESSDITAFEFPQTWADILRPGHVGIQLVVSEEDRLRLKKAEDGLDAFGRLHDAKLNALRREIGEKSPQSAYQPFLAIEHNSPDAAAKHASRIRDVEQRDAMAWSRFVFEGHPKGLVTLKKLLP